MVIPKIVPIPILLPTFAAIAPGSSLRETPIRPIAIVLKTIQEKLDVSMMLILSRPGRMRPEKFQASTIDNNGRSYWGTWNSYFCEWTRISVVTANVINVMKFESSIYIISCQSFGPLCKKIFLAYAQLTAQSALIFHTTVLGHWSQYNVEACAGPFV